jgi:hypothetical protein
MLRFVEKAAKEIPNFSGENGAEKLAAHMMGRWKSGIVTCPLCYTQYTDTLQARPSL